MAMILLWLGVSDKKGKLRVCISHGAFKIFMRKYCSFPYIF